MLSDIKSETVISGLFSLTVTAYLLTVGILTATSRNGLFGYQVFVFNELTDERVCFMPK